MSIEKYIQDQKIFDPRIIDDQLGNQRLWSSESVILANNGLKNGYKLTESPYNSLVKDFLFRKANLAFKYSDDELEVVKRCAKDKIFFGNNFVSLKDEDKGWQRITLRWYQTNLLNDFSNLNNRWHIIMFPRQSGKTTTTIIEIVHFLTYSIEKDCVVVAQSDTSVSEILKKIKEAFHSMPFFLQPGFISATKKGLVLDNGCRLSIGIAQESTVQGFSLDFLFIDEFAYIRENLAGKFWANIYPTLTTNPKSRCIIASTPNGRNSFYNLWIGAVNKTNTFKSHRIYWTDVPRHQDNDDFKRQTIKNVGEDAWLMGFECSFDVGLKSVFNSVTQLLLREVQKKSQHLWHNDNCFLGQLHDKFEFFDDKEYPYDIKNDFFLFSLDISEGLEQDSSVIKIKKIDWDIENKRLFFREIGILKDNEISVDDLAILTLDLSKFFDIKKIKIVVENNSFGGEYFTAIKYNFLHNSKYSWFDYNVIAKFWRDSKESYDAGIRWNEDNKKIAVKSFKTLVSERIIVVDHFLTIEEYLNFGRSKNGTYKANYGNDDLVLSDVAASAYIKSQNVYKDSFLKDVEYELRQRSNDKTEEMIQSEIMKIREAKQDIIISEMRTFKVRNHEKEIKKLAEADYTMLI